MNASVDYQFHLFTAAENSSRLDSTPISMGTTAPEGTAPFAMARLMTAILR